MTCLLLQQNGKAEEPHVYLTPIQPVSSPEVDSPAPPTYGIIVTLFSNSS